MGDIPSYPLYGSTFMLYRVSPLYHGDESVFTSDSLHLHARRFKEIVRGDTLRGVHVGNGDDSTATKAGQLQACKWDLIGDETQWAEDHLEAAHDDSGIHIEPTVTPQNARGIHIQLHYERLMHNALMLRDPAAMKNTLLPAGFTSLPLLLVRMPQPLRDTFIDYLSNTFDVRVSPLRPSYTFLTDVLERLLPRIHRSIDLSNDERSCESCFESTVKSIQIQLQWPHLAPDLRSIDLTIKATDVTTFVHAGLRRAQSQRHSEHVNRRGPFMMGLAAYLKQHIALKETETFKAVSRVACGAFAIGTEGRLKLFPPQQTTGVEREGQAYSWLGELSHMQLAMQEIYDMLIAEASSSGTQQLRSKRVEEGMKKTAGKRKVAEGGERHPAAVKKRAMPLEMEGDDVENFDPRGPTIPENERLPTDPPPPYTLHPPSIVT